MLLSLAAKLDHLCRDPMSHTITHIGQVYQAGAAINVIITSYLSDRWGRKRALHYNAFHAILGGALVCAAHNPTMFIVGRFFAGAGAWGYLAVST